MDRKKKKGFSLIEVNMAILVVATGVLAVAVLYPAGLRESVQSQSDFKQVMFADYVLNIAVAAACSTNVTWQEWSVWANQYNMMNLNKETKTGMDKFNSVPGFMQNEIKDAIKRYISTQDSRMVDDMDGTYAVYCMLVPGFSDQLMGIMVRSLDGDTSKMSSELRKQRLPNQPLFYAEARFQGRMEPLSSSSLSP